uniref:Fatty-acid and retinol-binding protein 1 n=1 Tax=Parastrongyloides trichosuri TaxID=131310 RepID=A0A0N4ZF96_PARTI
MVSIRFLILAVIGVAVVAGNTLPYDQLPAQLKEFVPEEVKDFYKGITQEDRAVLIEIAKNHDKYSNEEEAIAALKEKSPALGEKAESLYNMVKDKVNSLSEEPKAFAKELIKEARALRPAPGQKPDIEKLKVFGKTFIGKYQALTDAAKDELKTVFPKMHALAGNEKFQKLVKGFLNEEN